MGYLFFFEFQPHERIFYDVFAPGIFGERGLHHTKLLKWRVSAYAIHCVVIQKRNYQAFLTASFFHPIMKNVRPKPSEIY